MSKFYKLEVLQANSQHAYINEVKCWSGSNLVDHSEVSGISDSGNYYNVPVERAFDGQYHPQGSGILFWETNGDLPAWVIFEHIGNSIIDGISIISYSTSELHGPTEFKLYEMNVLNTPVHDDPGWSEVLYVKDLTNGGAYDPTNLTTNSVYSENTVHPFGSTFAPQSYWLLKNAAGAAFKYSLGNFVQVNASTPTEVDFINEGMDSVPKIPVSKLATWEPTGNFTLENYNTDAVSSTVKQLNITSVPKARIALPKGTIDVSGVSELNGINIVQNLAATGASRFAISIDGTNWKTWNGSSWADLNALAVDQTSADYLMTNGMTAAQMTVLSWTELQQLYTGDPTVIAVAYAVEAKVINDTAEIDHVELTVTHSGQKWVRDHGQIELEITGSGFVATPAINCTYKVNYQDTAA